MYPCKVAVSFNCTSAEETVVIEERDTKISSRYILMVSVLLVDCNCNAALVHHRVVGLELPVAFL